MESYSTHKIKHFQSALILMIATPLIVMVLAFALLNFSNNNNPIGQTVETTTSTVEPETVVSNLDTPWAMEFAPNGKLYITERKGTIRVYENGQLRQEPIYRISNTESIHAEEGLQGLALDPNFMQNGYIYIYYTTTTCNSGSLCNRLARLKVNPETAELVSAPTTIIDQIPGYVFHNGGRIKIGPDNKLYVATGDAADNNDTRAKAAQDLDSLAGKILRVNIPDASAPSDNPFYQSSSPNSNRSKVWSLGHRNIQGLAWHPTTGQLWATEHGPTGTPCCRDEVNIITKGGNYGWPRFTGDDIHSNGSISNVNIEVEPVTFPVWHSGGSLKWAPAGAMFYSGDKLGEPWTNSLLYVGLGFSGSAREIYRLRLNDAGTAPVQLDTLYTNQFGRLRDIIQGPDGAIYFSTSNRDGRGSPHSSDDRIIKLNPTGLPDPVPDSDPPPPPPPPPPPEPEPEPEPEVVPPSDPDDPPASDSQANTDQVTSDDQPPDIEINPTPLPPITVEEPSTSELVEIEQDFVVTNNDGTITADFTGDGLNEVAFDTNEDGFIDPTTEIISSDPALTDITTEPVRPRSQAEINQFGTTDAGERLEDPNTVAIKAGPLPEAKVSKPVAYTFLIAQGFALTGIGAYFAITKLTIFAGLRGRLGL